MRLETRYIDIGKSISIIDRNFHIDFISTISIIYGNTRVNIFTDSRWTDWFDLVVCMASNLIFRKQRYSGRRRSYIYPTWQCRIAISSTLIRGLWRQVYSFALATPGGTGLSRRYVLLIMPWNSLFARAWLRCCECHTRVTVTQNNPRTVASWYK